MRLIESTLHDIKHFLLSTTPIIWLLYLIK